MRKVALEVLMQPLCLTILKAKYFSYTITGQNFKLQTGYLRVKNNLVMGCVSLVFMRKVALEISFVHVCLSHSSYS